MPETEFRPEPPTPAKILESLKDSLTRTTGLLRLTTNNQDREPMVRLQSEKIIYLDCLKRFREELIQRKPPVS